MGEAYGASPLLLALIHPSAWKMNSRKFGVPHRHTKDRGAYTMEPRPRKGRLAPREATRM
jgi:hypothetical protein